MCEGDLDLVTVRYADGEPAPDAGGVVEVEGLVFEDTCVDGLDLVDSAGDGGHAVFHGWRSDRQPVVRESGY